MIHLSRSGCIGCELIGMIIRKTDDYGSFLWVKMDGGVVPLHHVIKHVLVF